MNRVRQKAFAFVSLYPAVCLALVAVSRPFHNPRESHPRIAHHPSLGRSRPCADQTNFARLSPGVGCCCCCCFRALRSHALSPSFSLSVRSRQLLLLYYRRPYRCLALSLSLSLFRSHPSAYGARRDSVAKFLEGLTYSMLCTRREICLIPNYTEFRVYAIFRTVKRAPANINPSANERAINLFVVLHPQLRCKYLLL